MRPLRLRPASTREERGAAMVEFALVLPLLLMVLLWMFDFGKAMNYWIDETHLANEAARYAAVNKSPEGDDAANLESEIRDQANTTEMRQGGGASLADPITVQVCVPEGNEVGRPVKATVTATYHWMNFVFGDMVDFVLPDTNLRGRATMRIEVAGSYPACS
jgi:Flp pilus assembly protein TadG